VGRSFQRNDLRPPLIIEHAVKDGAKAILGWAHEKGCSSIVTQITHGEIDRIPQAIVAREGAMWLARLASAYPGQVQVSLKMPNKNWRPD